MGQKCSTAIFSCWFGESKLLKKIIPPFAGQKLQFCFYHPTWRKYAQVKLDHFVKYVINQSLKPSSSFFLGTNYHISSTWIFWSWITWSDRPLFKGTQGHWWRCDEMNTQRIQLCPSSRKGQSRMSNHPPCCINIWRGCAICFETSQFFEVPPSLGWHWKKFQGYLLKLKQT